MHLVGDSGGIDPSGKFIVGVIETLSGHNERNIIVGGGDQSCRFDKEFMIFERHKSASYSDHHGLWRNSQFGSDFRAGLGIRREPTDIESIWYDSYPVAIVSVGNVGGSGCFGTADNRGWYKAGDSGAGSHHEFEAATGGLLVQLALMHAPGNRNPCSPRSETADQIGVIEPGLDNRNLLPPKQSGQTGNDNRIRNASGHAEVVDWQSRTSGWYPLPGPRRSGK